MERLIDIAMVAGLPVMMSGYENFVFQLDVPEGGEKLSWLGKMDSSSLKAKIAASIVAISSILLLLTFVASALAMGYLDILVRDKSKAA